MIRKNNLFSLGFVVISLAFGGCNRDGVKVNDDAESSEISQLSTDESDYSAEMEQATNDLDLAIFNKVNASGGRIEATLCGATIDSSMPNRYIVAFDGTTACKGRIRSGRIEVSLYNKPLWAIKDAVLGIDFQYYKVKIVATGKEHAFVGVAKVYNQTGGLAKNVLDGTGRVDSVVHRIRVSGLRANLSNSYNAEWNVAKTRTWVAKGENFFVRTKGDTTVNGQSNVSVWGRTRKNRAFFTQILQPIVATQNCGFGKPIAGQRYHGGFTKSVKTTFGVDASGNAIATGANIFDCAFGLKLEYTNRQGHQTRVIAYQ